MTEHGAEHVVFAGGPLDRTFMAVPAPASHTFAVAMTPGPLPWARAEARNPDALITIRHGWYRLNRVRRTYHCHISYPTYVWQGTDD